jgi:class 3 adenylate cyclase
MAASGIFNPAIESSHHANNTQLQIRVGVNTDGPLIAGVLGTEKPVFDIIRDAAEVASLSLRCFLFLCRGIFGENDVM